MTNRLMFHSSNASTRAADFPDNLGQFYDPRMILAALLVSGYILTFLILYQLIGTDAALFVSIPVMTFAYIFGLRYGLIVWFSLGILLNSLLLDFVGMNGWNELLKPEIGPQLVGLLAVAVVIGHMRDSGRYIVQHLEHQFHKQMSELTSANTSLNGEVVKCQQLIRNLEDALKEQKRVTDSRLQQGMMLSHEVKTPLSVILNSSYMLQNFGDKLSDQQKQRYFTIIQQEVDQLSELMSDWIELGKDEILSVRFDPEILNMEQFCGEIISTFQAALSSSHKVLFQCEGKDSEGYADPKTIRQILTNLLSNAAKYSPSGGEITLDLFCQKNEFIIQIRDQGAGIPEQDLNHLFEPFYRGSNAGITQGTGLGLVIVKRAVEMHGGQISVSSTLGVGTTFTVHLPRTVNKIGVGNE